MRYLMSLFVFTFTLALLCSLHTGAYSQSVSSSDGELYDLHPGYTYTLNPDPSAYPNITSPAGEEGSGLAVRISMSGAAGTPFQFQFHLPKGLTFCNDTLPTSFDSV